MRSSDIVPCRAAAGESVAGNNAADEINGRKDEYLKDMGVDVEEGEDFGGLMVRRGSFVIVHACMLSVPSPFSCSYFLRTNTVGNHQCEQEG